MTTRAERAAAAATAAQAKLAKLQAQQAQLAAELKRQRKLENDRIKALKDAERIELGRLVQEAGLDAEQLQALLAHKALVIGEPTPLLADAETPVHGADEIVAVADKADGDGDAAPSLGSRWD